MYRCLFGAAARRRREGGDGAFIAAFATKNILSCKCGYEWLVHSLIHNTYYMKQITYILHGVISTVD